MMVRGDKTQPADRAQAAVRLEDARAFLQQAEMSSELVDGPRRPAVVVSAAVMAGIAAADAACAIRLGKTSAGAHDQASKLLRSVSGSEKAATALSRLVNIKSTSQYAGGSITDRHARDAIERAQRLLEFAESCFRP